jgi:hypothetical protein
MCSEFICDGCATEDVGRDGRWERTTKLELERKKVATSFERMRMAFLSFEERPFMIAHDICERVRIQVDGFVGWDW